MNTKIFLSILSMSLVGCGEKSGYIMFGQAVASVISPQNFRAIGRAPAGALPVSPVPIVPVPIPVPIPVPVPSPSPVLGSVNWTVPGSSFIALNSIPTSSIVEVRVYGAGQGNGGVNGNLVSYRFANPGLGFLTAEVGGGSIVNGGYSYFAVDGLTIALASGGGDALDFARVAWPNYISSTVSIGGGGVGGGTGQVGSNGKIEVAW